MAFVQKKNLDHDNFWGNPATPHPSYTVPSDGNVQNTIRLEMSKDGIVYVNAYDNQSSPSDILNPFTQIAERNSGLGMSSDWGTSVKIYNEKIFVGDPGALDSNRTPIGGNDGGRVFVYNFDGDLLDSIRLPYLTYYNFGYDIEVMGSTLLIAARDNYNYRPFQFNAETFDFIYQSQAAYHGGINVSPDYGGNFLAKNGRIVRATVPSDRHDTHLNIFDHDGRSVNAIQHHHYTELLDPTLTKFPLTYEKGAPVNGKFAVGDGMIATLTYSFSDYFGSLSYPSTSKILGTVFDLNGGFKFFLETPDSDTYGPMFVDNRDDEFLYKNKVAIGGGRIAVPVAQTPPTNLTGSTGIWKVLLYDYSGNLVNVLHSRPHSDTSMAYDSDGMYFGRYGVLIADDRLLVLSSQYNSGTLYNLIHHYTLDGDYIFTDSDINRGFNNTSDCRAIDAREGIIAVVDENNRLYTTSMPRKRISVMDALDMY